jgi:hypothetical protein
MNPLLKKIIRAGVGRFRFIMATVGLGVAVLLILVAVQTQADFNDLLYGKYNENETADFLVINKAITQQAQATKNNAFSPAEIEELKKQPFSQSVGQLAAARFSVRAESYSGMLPFSSDLYFESVPDEFIDVKTDEWKWREGQPDVPVIIPSFFLDMYNTGMASTRENLPLLSLDVVKLIPVKIVIEGNGQRAEFTGHVVGLTDRINSILIPQTFMDFANARYGYKEAPKVTRLIVKTKDPSDTRLINYLEKNNINTNADKTRFGKVRKAVDIVVSVVSGFGGVMLLFALLVFSLFIQLTVASAKTEIELLITLGASPRQLSRFLMRQFFPANVLIMLVCLLVIAALQYGACQFLKRQNMFVSPWISPYTVGAALAVLAMVWVVYYTTIRKYVKGS